MNNKIFMMEAKIKERGEVETIDQILEEFHDYGKAGTTVEELLKPFPEREYCKKYKNKITKLVKEIIGQEYDEISFATTIDGKSSMKTYMKKRPQYDEQIERAKERGFDI